jgi:hypothetical protein
VRGKRPPTETVELAKEKGVPLLCTSLPMYESCGRLNSHNLAGCSAGEEQHIYKIDKEVGDSESDY